MKILITGAAGFIGFHLARKLLKCYNTIVGIDNLNDHHNVNLKCTHLAETSEITRESKKWHHIPMQTQNIPTTLTCS